MQKPFQAIGITSSTKGAERDRRNWQKSAKRSQSKASWKSGAIHSGEVVETKGGNHKTIKDWKAQYGAQEVESWLAQYDLRVQTKGSSRGLFYATVTAGSWIVEMTHKVLDWRNRRAWLQHVRSYAKPLLTPSLAMVLEQRRPQCWSDVMDWLPNHDDLVPEFCDRMSSFYTHFKAFHGCRPESLSSYYEHGLRGQAPTLD